MDERIVISEKGPVATVTLTRPNKRNALDPDMLKALVDAGQSLARRTDIRAVILTGDGPAFSAGLDISAFPKMAELVREAGGLEARTHGRSNIFQYVSMIWSELPMPVIAAVHGYAFGGALQIILGADIRIAAPDTRFSIMESKWGLVPDMGGVALMKPLVRSDIIRRLTYTAEIFDANQAEKWGFVTELSDEPLVRANELAREIATKSPDAIRSAKAMFIASQELGLEEILLVEARAQMQLIGTPNQTEAVMAAFENREPVFRDQ